jgi:hypothetical protein
MAGRLGLITPWFCIFVLIEGREKKGKGEAWTGFRGKFHG